MKKNKENLRGRPKGISKDERSFGPLGDLIRKSRLAKKMGLSEVANACNCSVQFISNIEHGRAPLPWEKIENLAKILGISTSSVQSANLTIRSEFSRFIKANGKKSKNNILSISEFATIAIQDLNLQNLIKQYQKYPPSKRASFIKTALTLMN